MQKQAIPAISQEIFSLTKLLKYANLHTLKHMKNAVMRNSTQGLEHRELLDGVKQRKEDVELASELLPEIFYRE